MNFMNCLNWGVKACPHPECLRENGTLCDDYEPVCQDCFRELEDEDESHCPQCISMD